MTRLVILLLAIAACGEPPTDVEDAGSLPDAREEHDAGDAGEAPDAAVEPACGSAMCQSGAPCLQGSAGPVCGACGAGDVGCTSCGHPGQLCCPNGFTRSLCWPGGTCVGPDQLGRNHCG